MNEQEVIMELEYVMDLIKLNQRHDKKMSPQELDDLIYNLWNRVRRPFE